MLAVEAPFPQVGSFAFLVGSAEPVRIQRRHPDGTCLISLLDKRFPREVASGNRTVDIADLAPTERDAVTFNAKPARRKRPVRRAR